MINTSELINFNLSIVDFEQVNVGWVLLQTRTKKIILDV